MKELAAYVEKLEDRPVAVFGLARSGLSTIRALKSAGAEVIAWDDDEKARDRAEKLGAKLEKLNEKNLAVCAFLLLAPGVPLNHPAPHSVVKSARIAGIEVICDVELFSRVYDNIRTIGVTGTNGKSTTTALIHHIIETSGRPAVMGGNIGVPVFDLEIKDKPFVVFELSSYQLDLCPDFIPEISVLLNITPDHIERHGTLENYAAAKKKIVMGQGVAIINADDALTRKIAEEAKAAGHRLVIPLTLNDEKAGEIKKHLQLKGDHNLQNAIAAYHACSAAALFDEEIFAGMRTFPGLPHRQFPVRTINNVTYINDSKATNAEAASKALHSYDNIYWIAGGRAKEGGLNGLEKLMGRVREAYLIGEAMDDFADWMKKNNVAHQKNKTLDAAVHAAYAAAQKNSPSVVLLSPACASFDQFSSYEERGDVFTKLVNNLEESAAA
ncbi:MAG: UDP-N-acetylmuramoyl-L-alanine--D-glutamate ligase [Alphaproteobacteria bacterium PRO2]|nr:UDP-N-acetylmuramoyl-L-alanine--D-glutamate ligase [Alphaproteobacteria bacterium PRO2]